GARRYFPKNETPQISGGFVIVPSPEPGLFIYNQSIATRRRQQLHLVSVRIFDERENAAAMHHRPRLAGDLAATAANVLARLVDIFHFQGDMPVAGTQLIALDVPI